VIVGVGQVRRRPELDGAWDPQEPTELMAAAIALALDDATQHATQHASELRAAVTGLACVDPLAWGYEDLVASTAARAGLAPSIAMTWPPGGNSPGDLLGALANRIVDGDLDVAVLAGSEAVYSIRRARKEGIDLKQKWTPFNGRRDFSKGQRPITNALERRHGMSAPIHCYPMFENALRAAAGRTITDHQQVVGQMMSRNTAVAANNPHAWFPTLQTPEQLITVDNSNRWVCFPYPKKLNAIMEVDQAAALVVMSQDEADRRGIARADQIEFLGGGSCQDPWSPSERPNLAVSEGIAAAANVAFGHAGITIDDVDLVGLYSCFPSAIEFAIDALGMRADDPRGVTLTGGLAYAGGPGNSYALHSMCVAVERLRRKEGRIALVSALGMTASKHAICLFGVDGAAPNADHRSSHTKLPDDRLFGPPLVDGVTGEGVVVSYTVEYDRSGLPSRTIYLVDLDDGTRTIGNGKHPQQEADVITVTEGIGRRVRVIGGQPSNDPTGAEPGQPNLVEFL
jgi:acetyl-CoA C-acetyltransferase